MGSRPITALLAFIGGFVDTAGFLGFNGLFLSHVTGNLATLCTAIVLGSKGYLGKILVLPEFMIVVALARLAGAGLQTTKAPVGRLMLAAEAVLLAVFFCARRWFRTLYCSLLLSASPPWRCKILCSKYI